MVRVAGVDVGKVTTSSFVGADVQVTLEVNEGEPVAHHRPVARLDRLAQPARRADHRDQPGVDQGTPLKDGDFIQTRGRPGRSPTSPRTRRRRSSRRPG